MNKVAPGRQGAGNADQLWLAACECALVRVSSCTGQQVGEKTCTMSQSTVHLDAREREM